MTRDESPYNNAANSSLAEMKRRSIFNGKIVPVDGVAVRGVRLRFRCRLVSISCHKSKLFRTSHGRTLPTQISCKLLDPNEDHTHVTKISTRYWILKNGTIDYEACAGIQGLGRYTTSHVYRRENTASPLCHIVDASALQSGNQCTESRPRRDRNGNNSRWRLSFVVV